MYVILPVKTVMALEVVLIKAWKIYLANAALLIATQETATDLALVDI